MSMPVFAGATTLAIGKIFMPHFESGRTFLVLNLRRCGLTSGKV